MSAYRLRPEFERYAKFQMPMNRAALSLADTVMPLVQPAGPVPDGLTERVVRVPVEGGSVPAVVTRPSRTGEPLPALVYFHGGGFALKAAAYHKHLARTYARDAGCVVVAPDYRLAPRHPYPVPPQDCLATYLWVCEHADEMGIDLRRVAVGGDSAGAGLACAVALLARDGDLPRPCFELLVYPMVDSRQRTASMARFVDTPMWNARLNARAWELYVPDEGRRREPAASPACADSLAELSPAYVETAEFDCLHDEGVELAESLRAAGVPARLNQTVGTMHGYDIVEDAPYVVEQVSARVAALREAFGK